jgi:hypothetical protein
MTNRFQTMSATVLLGCLVLGGRRSVFCQQPNGNGGSGARLESNQREGAASRSPKGERQPAGAAEKQAPPRKTHG